jgi:hypothetical protein
MTRAEFGVTCPLWPPHGPCKAHVWIETTVAGSPSRRFGCDVCPAWADEPYASESTKDWEPLSPACQPCPEPSGTCFPGPCKLYWARRTKGEVAA